uniref:Uncharacterized protein n=1 Tax=Solanum lycopersicum TaxID=4081 RepID=A0A3Q7G2V7_SOLLC
MEQMIVYYEVSLRLIGLLISADYVADTFKLPLVDWKHRIRSIKEVIHDPVGGYASRDESRVPVDDSRLALFANATSLGLAVFVEEFKRVSSTRLKSSIAYLTSIIILRLKMEYANGRPLDDDSAKAIDMINERMHINERSTNHNSGQDRVPQSSRISSNAEIALPHRTTHLYLLTLFFVFSCFVLYPSVPCVPHSFLPKKVVLCSLHSCFTCSIIRLGGGMLLSHRKELTAFHIRYTTTAIVVSTRSLQPLPIVDLSSLLHISL